MEARGLGAKFRLFFKGIFVPLFLYFLLCTFLSDSVLHSDYWQTDRSHRFYREFMAGELDGEIKDVDLVVLGDSTARAAFDPREFPHSAVNLGLYWGTALTSYHTLVSYLERRPAPRCLLMLYQYNWTRNYESFFNRVVNYQVFRWRDLLRIWDQSAGHGVFPASQHSYPAYLLRSLLGLARLNNAGLFTFRATGGELVPARKKIFKDFRKRRGYAFDPPARTEKRLRFFRPRIHGSYHQPFSPSETEDFYLREIARLAEEKGIHLVYGATPLADTEYFSPAEGFVAPRNQHIQRLFEGFPAARILELPARERKGRFADFVHFNRKGSRRFTAEFERRFDELCPR